MSTAPDDAPPFQPVDPYALARREAQATQLRRFYREASVVARHGGFALLLDERDASTPARQPIAVPTAAAAALIAGEWNAQGDVIKPADMPVTRLVNSVIDGVVRAMEPVRAEIVRFAGTDLLCYRADGPADLVAQQAAAWDPVVTWARDALKARFYLAQGVVHVAQPEHAIAAIDNAVTAAIGTGAETPFRLGALNLMTTLTGSALLGLAVLDGALTADEAWVKAHVDEDFQIARWGADAEAAERRDRRWRDMAAAAALAEALPCC